MQTALSILGIMSGTSMDGVDYVLCHVSGKTIRFRKHWHVPFPQRLRTGLSEAARGLASAHKTGVLHHELGRFYAEHCPEAPGVKLAGLHGQTIFHDASKKATLQIGEPAWLARRLKAPVVSNFRAADLAAGGQGAPLATLFHKQVFSKPGKHICVNNLGGISNVTSLDATKSESIRAFDTGPGCMLLDLAVRYLSGGKRLFDKDGKLALAGKPDEALVKRWLRHPYFGRRPPKSTGRELFGEEFLGRALSEMRALGERDILATLALFTAESIALNYARHLSAAPDEVVLCGGGERNPALFGAIARAIQGKWPACAVSSSSDWGWASETIEAAAFALLAWRRWFELPGNIPETTGASESVILGQVTLP